MAARPPPLPPAPPPPGPLEFPLTAFPDHPVARALRDDGLSRRWLLPVGGLSVTAAGGNGGGGMGPVPPRPAATAMVSRAALTQPGLAQRVGWTSDVEADDGRVVQQVHLMVRCGGAVGAGAATERRRGRLGGGWRVEGTPIFCRGCTISDGADGAGVSRAVQDPDHRADVMAGHCPPLSFFCLS